MRSKCQIKNESVLREKIVKEVQAELFNEEKLFVSDSEEPSSMALSVVSVDSSLLSRFWDVQSIKTAGMSITLGDKRSKRDDDSTAVSLWSLNTNVGDVKHIKSMMDDDTAPFSEEGSIISEVTPRVSNCVTPACADFEATDLDQHGIVSCVGKEVADTSFAFVDACVFLDENLLLDEFFNPAQVQSLQNTFQQVSTEFDSAADTAGSLVQDLTYKGQEMANKLIVDLSIKAPRKKKKPRTITQQAAPREPSIATTVPIREVRVKSHAHLTPSQVEERKVRFAHQTPSQVKELSSPKTPPPKAPPPKGEMLLPKLAGRLGRRNKGRLATKTV
jgi:hypothetical protein